MNTMKRFQLHQLREKIVQDLDVKHVMEYLEVRGAISSEDSTEIRQEKERSDQTRRLLDILPKKGPEAFDCFVDSLKKDYYWLYKEFTEYSCLTDSVQESEKTFHDALLIGGVPHPPPYNVSRKKKLHEVYDHLKNLERGKYVVLHGMTGSGKSCLAAAAVYDRELLMSAFQGSIFWITTGLCDNDELLSIMNDLIHCLDLNVFQNNVSPEVASTKERAREQLKRYFLDDRLRKGLLILDDVTSADHIDAFDIGCKTLVITKDLDVMKKVSGRFTRIEVNEGFTENESLSLMAQSIGIPVSILPPQARSIHFLSKGCPMVIALIAGQLDDNRDDVKYCNGRWEYYVNLLSEKQFSQFRRNSFFEQNGLLQTISSIIANLPSEKREYYLDFALFMEDVNIKPEVLQTLWSLNSKYEVENIMAYFTKKSLAVYKWNEQLSSSVYGIHDLLLHYLKVELTNEKRKDLHRKLLRKYSELCQNDYAALPNDNYIYSYIGYHMHQAEEFTMFSKVFLDLEFIQSKLRNTGPADVLGDFKKYRELIISQNDSLIQELEDLTRFVQLHGLDLYRFEDLDIVQCGLLEKKDSTVYKKAYNTAKMNSQKLYLECLSDPAPVSFPLTLPLREDVLAACFTNDSKKILIADGSCIIKLWKLDTFEMVNTFHGHLSKVTYLKLHPDKQRFLSGSEDGSLKLWSLDYFVTNNKMSVNSAAGNDLEISSPQYLQRNWNSMFLNDSPKDDSIKTFSKHKNAIITAKFSNIGREIVSCSKDSCIIWDCENGNINFILQMNGHQCYTSCTFSNDDSQLFFGDTNSKITIFEYKSKVLDFLASFSISSNVISIFIDPLKANKIVVVCPKDIKIWEWDKPLATQRSFAYKKQTYLPLSMENILQSSFGEKERYTYICAASSDDGTYLVTASSDHVLSVWNLKTRHILATHKNYNGLARCLDTYCRNESIPLLLCGSDDRTVKIWHLDQQSTDLRYCSASLMAQFDSFWIKRETWLPTVACIDSKNRLQVLHGNCSIRESHNENEQITICVMADSGFSLFYGCVNGEVKMFDIMSGNSQTILKLDCEITYLKYHRTNSIFLIAAGDAKSLKFWKDDGTISICCGQSSTVVQTFLVPNSKQILACTQDAEVKLWNTESGQLSQIVIGPRNAHITCADVNDLFNLLVMGDQDGCFYMVNFALNSEPTYIIIESLKLKTLTKTESLKVLNHGVRCCKISPNGLLLALGLCSGSVMMWSLKNEAVLKNLELHTSPVQNVLFGNSNEGNCSNLSSCILVTIAEKIGWWNVSALCSDRELKFQSSSSLPPSVEVKPSDFAESNEKSIQNILQKEEKCSKPFLLACVKLIGSTAMKLSCSPDFTNFVTVDTSGIVYLLSVLK